MPGVTFQCFNLILSGLISGKDQKKGQLVIQFSHFLTKVNYFYAQLLQKLQCFFLFHTIFKTIYP